MCGLKSRLRGKWYGNLIDVQCNINLTNLGSSHLTASICFRPKFLANIHVLPKVDHSKNIKILTEVGFGT